LPLSDDKKESFIQKLSLINAPENKAKPLGIDSTNINKFIKHVEDPMN